MRAILIVFGLTLAFPAGAFEWDENYGQPKAYGWYQDQRTADQRSWGRVKQEPMIWHDPQTNKVWGYDDQGRYFQGQAVPNITAPRAGTFCTGRNSDRVCQ